MTAFSSLQKGCRLSDQLEPLHYSFLTAILPVFYLYMDFFSFLRVEILRAQGYSNVMLNCLFFSPPF